VADFAFNESQQAMAGAWSLQLMHILTEITDFKQRIAKPLLLSHIIISDEWTSIFATVLGEARGG
jgi:hypothetical protein